MRWAYQQGHALPAPLRWLTATWRIGRFFGVEVRVHVLTVLVPIFAFLEISRWGISAGEARALVAIWTVGLYVVIWTHEMGHILAGRRWNLPTSLITLSPLGGLAHFQAPPPSPRADIAVALAGPATHLLWLAVAWPLSLVWQPESWIAATALHNAVHVNLALLLFNLLPCFPLDGGRAFRGLLALRLHASRASWIAANVGSVGAVLMFLSGFLVTGFGGALLMMLAIRGWFDCRDERMAARFGHGPYGVRRAAWEEDADAWKHGGGEPERGARKPGWLERRRFARAAAATARREREERERRDELDALLARVGEVGLAAMTPRERDRLKALSEALRASNRR